MLNQSFALKTSLPVPPSIYSGEKTGDKIWFPGLNGLRFIAAFLVVIMHIHNNMGISGLPQLPRWPVLFKGLSAVSFFFVLSGFLITFLLLKEFSLTRTIHVRAFYLRRVFRIWPLYFLVIFLGLLFYWRIVPALHLPFENKYNLGLAITLYAFFMANLMNSLFHVGGMLHVTWSIAVEEQFYLFWAPLVKRFRGRLPLLISVVTVLSLVLHVLNTLNVFNNGPEIQAFLSTLQFHFMGFGAGFAWLLFNRKEWLLGSVWISNRFLQIICLSILLGYFLFYMKSLAGDIITPVPLGLLFGWLIISVSSGKGNWHLLENPVFSYLGKISYGIYMYHMPVVYLISFIFRRLGSHSVGFLYFPLFYSIVFGLVIGIASLSYFYIERPVLKWYKNPAMG